MPKTLVIEEGVAFNVLDSNDKRIDEKATQFRIAQKRIITGQVGPETGYLVNTIGAKQYYLERKPSTEQSVHIRISVPHLDYSKTGWVQSWRVKPYQDIVINGNRCWTEVLGTPVEAGVTVRDIYDRMIHEEEEKDRRWMQQIKDQEAYYKKGSRRLGVQQSDIVYNGDRSCSPKPVRDDLMKNTFEEGKPDLSQEHSRVGGKSSGVAIHFEDDLSVFGASGRDRHSLVPFEPLPEYCEIDQLLNL